MRDIFYGAPRFWEVVRLGASANLLEANLRSPVCTYGALGDGAKAGPRVVFHFSLSLNFSGSK